MIKKLLKNSLSFLLPSILLVSVLTIDLTDIFYLNQFFWYVVFAYLFLVLIFFLVWFTKKYSQIKEFAIFSVFFLIFLLIWLVLWNFFVSGLESYDNQILRTSWKLAFLYLSFALIMTPLSNILGWKYQENFIFFRKILGILAFLFFSIHFFYYIEEEAFSHFGDLSLLAYIFKNLLERYDALIWVFAWIIMIILWITSNKFSQRLLWSTWKWLHYLVYPLFLISMLHIAFAGRFDLFYASLFVMVVGLRFYDFMINFDKSNIKKSWKTTKYLCVVCGYIYDEKKWDPDGWLPAWTKFEDIPDDWVCPVCGVTKKDFVPYYEDEQDYTNAEIATLEYITKDVIKLEIKLDHKLSFQAWQFMQFILEDFDWQFIRQYSIAYQNENVYWFMIKLKETWRAGKLFPKLSVWDNIYIWWVYWDFVLKNSNTKKVFIATGTWLAPVYNMIKNTDENTPKELHFGVERFEDLFFTKELEKITNLEINYYLSKEEKSWYNYWRIDANKFDYDLETEFYICWNPNMVQEVSEILSNKWYKYIYNEKFN